MASAEVKAEQEKITKEKCTSDPNFAVVCAFIERFGSICGMDISLGIVNYKIFPGKYLIGNYSYFLGVLCPSILRLQELLEDNNDVKDELILFHVKLLRKLKKSVSLDKWERFVTKFAHTYSSSDGWELERFGYKRAKLNLKLRLLKNLLEAQFDGNVKFKAEINTKDADDLRMEPLGRDKLGNLYWYQVDGDASMRVYKDDPEEETWELVAQNR